VSDSAAEGATTIGAHRETVLEPLDSTGASPSTGRYWRNTTPAPLRTHPKGSMPTSTSANQARRQMPTLGESWTIRVFSSAFLFPLQRRRGCATDPRTGWFLESSSIHAWPTITPSNPDGPCSRPALGKQVLQPGSALGARRRDRLDPLAVGEGLVQLRARHPPRSLRARLLIAETVQIQPAARHQHRRQAPT